MVYNWSTDTKRLLEDKEKAIVWRLEQMINFGLRGQKLKRKWLKKYWAKLHIDPLKKRYLEFVLWGRQRKR